MLNAHFEWVNGRKKIGVAMIGNADLNVVFCNCLANHEAANNVAALVGKDDVVDTRSELRGVDCVGYLPLSLERAGMDSAAVDVDNGHDVVGAVAEVDLEVGLVVAGVGEELTEVIVGGGHLVDAHRLAVVGLGPICAEEEGDVLHWYGGGVEIVERAIDGLDGVGIVGHVVAEIAALRSGHWLGDGFAVVAGGSEVVFDCDSGVCEDSIGVECEGSVVGIGVGSVVGNNRRISVVGGIDSHQCIDGGIDGDGVDNRVGEVGLDVWDSAKETVAVGGQAHGLPRAASHALGAGSGIDAALVGDDGAHGHILAQGVEVVGATVDVFVQNAVWVVGRARLADAVDGDAIAVEGGNVDAIDGVARIGLL